MSGSGYTLQGSVAVVRFGEPPVNSLGHETRERLLAALNAAVVDAQVNAIVLAGNGDLFSGGADIREFGTPLVLEPPTLPALIDWLDAATTPVVAAIGGTCLGGGLELALACHGRVAAAHALLGLPEVKLGLLPGAGGTQRLPRLVGIAKALDMIVTGDPVSAASLAGTGLIDRVVDADPIAAAVNLASLLAAGDAAPRRTRDRMVREPDAPALCSAARAAARGAGLHYPAPLRCIDAVEAALEPFDRGLAIERTLFLELMRSPESRALRHAFFAERAAAKVDGVTPSTPTRAIATAAIVGGGTMGTGIALSLLGAGIPVTLLEIDTTALDRGVARIRELLAGRLSRGRITAAAHDRQLALLKPTVSYADLADQDIAIEAVVEDMAVKERVFATLDSAMKSGAILATNTSTLDVDRLAAATARPERVVGTHFFSPAHVMRLLEVVRGKRTTPEVLASILKLAKTIGKVPVVCGICDGFIGNRMLHRYTQQAGYLLEEGASPEQIDAALETFGMAMGPFRMGDLAGNDIGWHIRKRRYATDPGFRYPGAADKLCALGRFGQKTGAGWYDYAPGSRTGRPSPIVATLLAEHRASLGIKPRVIDAVEIVDRLILALVNEAAAILDEGIAARPSDIDVVYLLGYGFPRWRGGPLFYADQTGLERVVRRIEEFGSRCGADADFWRPAPLLARLAAAGETLTAAL